MTPPNRKCWSSSRQIHIGTCADAWEGPQYCVCNPADADEYSNETRLYAMGSIKGVSQANIKTYFDGVLADTYYAESSRWEYMYKWWDSNGWTGVVRFDLCSGGTVITSCSTTWVGPDPCEGVVCEPTCFGADKHETTCVDGSCVKSDLIEANCHDCPGYVPPPLECTTSECDLLLEYDTDNDGTIDSHEYDRAEEDVCWWGTLTSAQLAFIKEARDLGEGGINKLCPGCYSGDPCEGVVCEPTCFGADKHETTCVDGSCVKSDLIEANCHDCPGYVPPDDDEPDDEPDPGEPDDEPIDNGIPPVDDDIPPGDEYPPKSELATDLSSLFGDIKPIYIIAAIIALILLR